MVDVTVHAPMSLKKYPYDRHIVPFCLATRATYDAQGEETKWVLRKEWPEWAPSKYSEDKTILLEDQTTPDLEYNHKQCMETLEGRDEWALEADIFQVRAAEKAKEKKVNEKERWRRRRWRRWRGPR